MTQLTEFWIDVGGTFTDCLMKSPDGRLSTYKVLSSGITKGRVTEIVGERQLRDEARVGDAAGFWAGCTLTLLDETGAAAQSFRVVAFDVVTGTFTLDEVVRRGSPDPAQLAVRYELSSGEEAPILAIRTALGLRLDEAIPPVIVRLGTTRGTNALLTRKGARTGFVTTKGFRDVLLIANQDRLRLFDLAIQKPEPLFAAVAEIDERLDAAGNVLIVPVEATVRERLLELKVAGCESLAICLLHAFANPIHEQVVERIAREVGFTEISTSSRLSPLIKIVSRGDTTVMDAYVNPILRDYVGKLRESLAGQGARAEGQGTEGTKVTFENETSTAETELASSPLVPSVLSVPCPSTLNHQPSLKLMTSAGGLVDADRFTGKDSVLSGPAGGVIGFSRVAQRAGFAKSIGFDMGGTSTDVSRFDGRYEREFETTKAGVRVVAPMLAIETVAAGGGSVCGFDGVKLFVGPQSAGANPGPACYGRGGPLTITDVNFFLGKIIPERFPFPLDRTAVERRLADFCERVANSPLGRSYSPHELAQGFIDIANTTMARAIRKISVSKGYDPAEYALVTFGGAGAQHACALAKSLGMATVLSHPYSGVLSAYGIGLADVRQLRERGVLKPFSRELLAELESHFVEMADSARDAVLAEGIPAERIDAPIRSLDLRYRGVEASLNVTEPSDGDYASAYAERHQQLYGYTRPDRPLEVVAARIEVVGKQPDPVEPSESETPREPQPHSWTETWFDGRPQRTAVFLREQLHPGDTFIGPAILCEPTSTVVVDPGFEASIRGRGEIVIESRESRAESREPEEEHKANSDLESTR
ncbi:MAG: hydantoinase/oxoprolinase family protein, partial [Planctomycetota bacterium]